MLSNMKTIAISIEEDMLARIDQMIEEQTGSALNRSSIIRQAVREHLSRLDRTSEEQREKAIFKRHRRKLEQQAKALVREQAKP